MIDYDGITELKGELDASGREVGIVVSQFNGRITDRLLDGALDTFWQHGADGTIDVVRVPGAWELPVVAERMAKSGEYDALVCLGTVIRGETPHFEYVAGEAASELARLATEAKLPIGFGVLTTETTEQALDRAGVKQGNKGAEAAEAAIETTNVLAKF